MHPVFSATNGALQNVDFTTPYSFNGSVGDFGTDITALGTYVWAVNWTAGVSGDYTGNESVSLIIRQQLGFTDLKGAAVDDPYYTNGSGNYPTLPAQGYLTGSPSGYKLAGWMLLDGTPVAAGDPFSYSPGAAH